MSGKDWTCPHCGRSFHDYDCDGHAVKTASRTGRFFVCEECWDKLSISELIKYAHDEKEFWQMSHLEFMWYALLVRADKAGHPLLGEGIGRDYYLAMKGKVN